MLLKDRKALLVAACTHRRRHTLAGIKATSGRVGQETEALLPVQLPDVPYDAQALWGVLHWEARHCSQELFCTVHVLREGSQWHVGMVARPGDDARELKPLN